MATRLTSRKHWFVKYSASSFSSSTSRVVYTEEVTFKECDYVREDELEGLHGVPLDPLGLNLVLGVDPPREYILLLEQLLLLLHQLLEHLLILPPRLLLETLGFPEGDSLLPVEFEPGVELVVEDLAALKDEVAIAEDLLGQAVVQLLDLRDVRLAQEHSEALDLRGNAVEFVCEVVGLGLDHLAAVGDERINLRVSVDIGVEVVTEPLGSLSCLYVDLPSQCSNIRYLPRPLLLLRGECLKHELLGVRLP
jgi:hypothetical protein